MARHFNAVIDTFDQVMNHGGDAAQAHRALDAASLPGGLVNGFAHGQAGIAQVA